MKTGPWQYSSQVQQYARLAGTTSPMHPYRMTDASFDETDYDLVRGVLDAEHARAIVFGKQTATQFGYGVYDVHFHLIPSTGALNPDTTENGLGEFGLHFYHPTPLRMDALKALKALEIEDDSQDIFSSGTMGVANPSSNPLLSIDLDTDESDTSDGTGRPKKGSKIIRFGWSGQTSGVVAQSSLTVNLNPSADDDVNDPYERQRYVLSGGDNEHFGILQRMERSVNPMVQTGQTMVEEEWFAPVNLDRVQGQTVLRQPVGWGIADSAQGTVNALSASFYGVHALGGLMGFTLPGVFVQQGTGNNDYDIVVTVKGRKWVPLA